MELSLSDLKDLLGNRGADSHSFVIGKNYLIRCVTFYYTGKLVSVTKHDLVLEDAAWIADTGRFHDCLASGTLKEVEEFPNPVIIPKSSIIDATEWRLSLPRSVFRRELWKSPSVWVI